MSYAMTKLQKARTKLLLRHPFYGTLVMTSPMIEDRSLPTAATDMKNIYYNPDFFDSLSQDVIEFVIIHEVMHIALMHGLRLKTRNHKKWNRACDYAINLMLKNDGFTLWENCLIDAKYAGMSAEQIYNTLDDEGGGGGGGGDLSDDLREPSTMTPQEEEALRVNVQQRVAHAANVARMAGKMGGELARLVDQVLNPTPPWEDILRDQMTRVVAENESWTRRNRRFSNIYLPSRHSVKLGRVIFIGDTSGSIGQEELNKVWTQANEICERLQPEGLKVIWADTKVAGEQDFEVGDPLTFKPRGGGGTDMRVPLEYVEQFDPPVVIMVTDGYTPWPSVEPPYPLIVCCTTGVDVPVGQVVRI